MPQHRGTGHHLDENGVERSGIVHSWLGLHLHPKDRRTALYEGDASNDCATSPCNAPDGSVTLTALQAPA